MTESEWYYARGEEQVGPVGEDELRALIAGGQVTADTLVWTQGMSNWIAAGRVPGLSAAADVVKAHPTESPEPAYATPAPADPADAPGAPTEPTFSGLAIASLVLALMLPCGCIMSIPAIILGHMALRQIAREPERYKGRGVALAGTILGYLSITLHLLLFLISFAGAIINGL